MTTEVKMIRSTVKAILTRAEAYAWSIQGFGMLRLHLADEFRINVWDGRFRVPGVSLMHTHPWDFDSLIVSGMLNNVRFSQDPAGTDYEIGMIKPGPGGGLLESAGRTFLAQQPTETYQSGQWYRQVHSEIHISDPADGCVTFNRRHRVGEDRAMVYWPRGETWVSAEPRAANTDEIRQIASLALAGWGRPAPAGGSREDAGGEAMTNRDPGEGV